MVTNQYNFEKVLQKVTIICYQKGIIKKLSEDYNVNEADALELIRNWSHEFYEKHTEQDPGPWIMDFFISGRFDDFEKTHQKTYDAMLDEVMDIIAVWAGFDIDRNTSGDKEIDKKYYRICNWLGAHLHKNEGDI